MRCFPKRSKMLQLRVGLSEAAMTRAWRGRVDKPARLIQSTNSETAMLSRRMNLLQTAAVEGGTESLFSELFSDKDVLKVEKQGQI